MADEAWYDKVNILVRQEGLQMKQDARLNEAIEMIERVIVGKRREIQLCLIALLARGHILLEDVPGVGKTMLVKSMAKTLGMEFKRIQFTPDMLPSDVTGASIYNQKTQTFEFRPGPIMANIVLADEINRTSPKTQSALLEALEEGHITVDGETMELKKPFFVMATQNPIEYAGTFPLPEAQLDRFLFKIRLGYPSFSEEMEILNRMEKTHPLEKIAPVLSPRDVLEMQQEVAAVYVDELVKTYILNIVHATRNHPDIRLGLSPRASIMLMRAGQAEAFLRGRDYVIPDDIKALVFHMFNHRLLLKTNLSLKDVSVEKVVEEIVSQIPVPVKKKEAMYE